MSVLALAALGHALFALGVSRYGRDGGTPAPRKRSAAARARRRVLRRVIDMSPIGLLVPHFEAEWATLVGLVNGGNRFGSVMNFVLMPVVRRRARGCARRAAPEQRGRRERRRLRRARRRARPRAAAAAAGGVLRGPAGRQAGRAPDGDDDGATSAPARCARAARVRVGAFDRLYAPALGRVPVRRDRAVLVRRRRETALLADEREPRLSAPPLGQSRQVHRRQVLDARRRDDARARRPAHAAARGHDRARLAVPRRGGRRAAGASRRGCASARPRSRSCSARSRSSRCARRARAPAAAAAMVVLGVAYAVAQTMYWASITRLVAPRALVNLSGGLVGAALNLLPTALPALAFTGRGRHDMAVVCAVALAGCASMAAAAAVAQARAAPPGRDPAAPREGAAYAPVGDDDDGGGDLEPAGPAAPAPAPRERGAAAPVEVDWSRMARRA